MSWGDGAVLYSDYDGATRIYTPVKICGTAYHKEVNCTVFFLFNLKIKFKILFYSAQNRLFKIICWVLGQRFV